MQYTLSSSDLLIRVDTHGAELTSLRFQDREFLYQKTPGYWQRQSPILFPIVGALRDGQYSYAGERFALSQHGFARDREFSLVEQSASHLAFVLRSDELSFGQYPFLFSLTLRYTLIRSGLQVEYFLENQGNDTLFASIGGHPAFALEHSIDQYSLLFPEDATLSCERLVAGLLDTAHIFSLPLSDHILPLSEEIFEQDALILRDMQSRVLFFREGDRTLFRFDRGNFPHFALWKQRNAPFLCLEPWQGYADSTEFLGEFSEKGGIVALDPEDVRVWKWTIDFMK